MYATIKEFDTEIRDLHYTHPAIFEIAVTNTETKEEEFILVSELLVDGNQLIAKRTGFSIEEDKSNKISYSAVDIELDKGINYHLEGIYEALTADILSSSRFELRE